MDTVQQTSFNLPALPYAEDALEPHMSADTLSFHHGKHHRAYVDKFNGLIEGTDLADKSLDEIVKTTFRDSERTAIFNNGAQHWNHSFFWRCMKPKGGGAMPASLEKRIAKDFGDVDAFKKEFVERGVGQFGSGWVWLIEDGDRLSVVSTTDAENPLAMGKRALLTCDVWEHAYYLDYQNRRPDFLKAFVDHLADWDAAARRLEAGAR